MELSKEIKAAREKLNLSQSEAARAWEIPRKTLQNWEQGVSAPRGFALKAVREALERALSQSPPEQ